MEKLKMSSEYLSRAISELEYVQLSELDRMRYDAKIYPNKRKTPAFTRGI